MDKYQVIYEYTYFFHKSYTFKKQICIDDNKHLIFNFIVNDLFSDNLLLTINNNDFKDIILNNTIKSFLISEIKNSIKVKTLGMCLKGINCDVETLKYGIKINNKVFKLKNDDYDMLETKTLDYIETLKHQ